MGLFDRIFGSRKPVEKTEAANFFKTFTAYQPVFHTWNGGLYESELVRSAIDARARNIAKLQVEIIGSANPGLQARLKKAPNEFQTWSQFLYRLSTILDVQNTAFIVPIFDNFGSITGFYPVLPSKCEVVEYKNIPYIRYTFKNGQKAAVELSLCGIMTKFQYQDDFFGDSNGVLVPTMELIHIQNQGITEGVKNSATYRFMAQMANFSKAEDLKKERERFSRENFAGEGGGVLLFPNTYNNIKQIDNKPFVVDAAQMNLIRTNVYNYFGVNEDVLQNKAFGDSWSAFYEGAIEPFAIQFSEVLTKMCFTMRERAQGSMIMATSNRLQYMSNQDKLNVSASMADRGIMSRDEIRAIWNLPPIPEGKGEDFIARGEYYFIDKESKEADEDANQE